MATVMTVLSALALGLVVCLHVPSLPKCRVFYLGVPWFFLASGLWYARGLAARGYGGQVRRRVRSLLLPYFLWNLLWFPILLLGNWVGWRFCGATRVIDASVECVVRCLGLSPFSWPALVPTWFLRALFVAVVLVGGVAEMSRRLGRFRMWVTAAFFWAAYLLRDCWMPEGPSAANFFTFALPLQGCALFATGLALGCRFFRRPDETRPRRFVCLIRRQMMPVYVLHAAVIVSIGWVARACGVFGYLTTVAGDIVMWLVGVLVSIVIGEAMRRKLPKVSGVLFGGR